MRMEIRTHADSSWIISTIESFMGNLLICISVTGYQKERPCTEALIVLILLIERAAMPIESISSCRTMI